MLPKGSHMSRPTLAAESETMMPDMPYDMSEAVHYRLGAFPPSNLDYKRLLESLDEASSALARFDAKIAGMVNSELFLGPLRRQDAISSSRMEGTISTIEDLYRLEAEEAAGGANLTARPVTTTLRLSSILGRSATPRCR